MLGTGFLLSIDSNNPRVNDDVDKPNNEISPDSLDEIKQRYGIICTVSARSQIEHLLVVSRIISALQ